MGTKETRLEYVDSICEPFPIKPITLTTALYKLGSTVDKSN
jgi:hypothetical protein